MHSTNHNLKKLYLKMTANSKKLEPKLSASTLSKAHNYELLTYQQALQLGLMHLRTRPVLITLFSDQVQ